MDALRYRGRYKQWLVPLPLSFLQFPLLLWRLPFLLRVFNFPSRRSGNFTFQQPGWLPTRPKDESRPTPSPISQRIYLFQAIFLNCSTYEDCIDRLSRNVSNQLPTYATQYLRRAKASMTPRRKPEISHTNDLIRVWRKWSWLEVICRHFRGTEENCKKPQWGQWNSRRRFQPRTSKIWSRTATFDHNRSNWQK